MNSVLTVVIYDPNDLMSLGEGIPHAEETSECPNPPIWDVQLGYIVVVQDN